MNKVDELPITKEINIDKNHIDNFKLETETGTKRVKEKFHKYSAVDSNLSKLPFIPEEYLPKYKLIENIVKAQQSQNITDNLLPNTLNWDYGLNEKFDDMKKLQVLKKIQGVGAIPYSIRAKIIMPILKKLIDDDYSKANQKEIDELVNEYLKEQDNIKIDFGEV